MLTKSKQRQIIPNDKVDTLLLDNNVLSNLETLSANLGLDLS